MKLGLNADKRGYVWFRSSVPFGLKKVGTYQVAGFHLLLQHWVVEVLLRVHQGLVPAGDDLATVKS